MGFPENDWGEFRRDADVLLQRLRAEGKLHPLRAVLALLLPAVGAMNLGDVGNCLLGEDVAEREAFDLLDDLGCLAVLNRQKDGALGARPDGTVTYELFSKRQLAYLAENIADTSRSES